MEFNIVSTDTKLLEVTKGNIDFPQLDVVKEQVSTLVSYLEQVEVNEDNVKDSKKLVAKVRKFADAINRERIDAKKEILQPYNDIEIAIKELTSLIDKGDNIVREQIKELEEKAREDKERDIKDLWTDLSNTYACKDFLNFDDFMLPQYLNKSISMSKIHELIVDYCTTVSDDLEIIESHPLKSEILKYYPNVSVARAIKMAKEDKERENKAKEYERKLSEATEVVENSKLKEVIENLNKKEFKTIKIESTRIMDILIYCDKNNIEFEVVD